MKALKITLAASILAIGALAVAQFPGGGGQRGGFGQRGMRMMGGMGGGIMPTSFLVQREDVQDELKLSADQKLKLQNLREQFQQRMMEQFQRGGGAPGGGGGGGQRGGGGQNPERMAAMQKMMEEANKSVNEVLTEPQRVRARQIAIQMAGPAAAMDKEIGEKLGVTEAQRKSMQDLQQKAQQANRAVMQRARDGELDWQQAGESMAKNGEVLNTELGKVLTEAQRKMLAEMGGPKFTPKEN